MDVRGRAKCQRLVRGSLDSGQRAGHRRSIARAFRPAAIVSDEKIIQRRSVALIAGSSVLRYGMGDGDGSQQAQFYLLIELAAKELWDQAQPSNGATRLWKRCEINRARLRIVEQTRRAME